MGNKGKKKKVKALNPESQQSESQHQSGSSTQQQQQPLGPQQSQPHGPQQQQQQPTVAQQQPQPRRPQQQQQPLGSQQSQPRGPQQQQQQPTVAQQQPQPRRPQQQQQPLGPQQSQPRGPQQQQQPLGPQQSQPRGPQQQQQQPIVAQQQPQPRRPQQQQPTVAQQQPQYGQQQQQQPLGPQQSQPRGPHQQQQQPIVAQQQPQPRRPQQHQPVPQQLISSQQSEAFASQAIVPVVTKSSGRSVLSSSLQQSYLDQIPRKSNPNGGTLGRRITVETNMLKLIFSKNFQTSVVHYDVVITPEKPKFLLKYVFEEFRKKHFPNRFPAFDGKNAYSAGYLPFGNQSREDTITIFDNEFKKDRSFNIYLREVSLLDLSWLTSSKNNLGEGEREQKGLQALDIMLRHGSAYQCISVGKSIFQPPEPGRVVKLSGGLDLWVGVFQSVVIGSKPYLNIDVAHKGFPSPQSVVDLMRELCQDPRDQRGGLPDISSADIQRNHNKINKFLKGLKVQYEIPQQPNTKRTYRVNGLVECPRKNTFSIDGRTCTVEQYFLQTKRYRIMYPDVPCLWVGSQGGNTHLPAELCTIVAGQAKSRKLDEMQTAKMVRAAATDTNTRKQKIMDGFSKMNLNNQPTLTKEFHLSVNGEFEKVPARVLDPPVLQYNESNVTVSKGVWRAKKFLQSCNLADNSWTILNLERRLHERDLYDLQQKLQSGGLEFKMTIGRARTPFGNLSIQGTNIANINKYFEEKKKEDIKLIIVILPTLDYAYSAVKQISELRIPGGIVTQCIKSQTLRKLTDATIGNILLKINSKLNGVNHTFALTHRPRCLARPCMIIGADVTHPSPDATDIPSIAAVAASHDPNAFKYNIEIRLQLPREEMIQDLEEIMISQLKYFYSITGCKPLSLIFYRDGVSEGQLTHVMHFELSAIKKAIARLERTDERKIAITFFVVQKRHHIRLFPTDRRNTDDRNINVQAGTIVDTEIVHQTHIDFYLVSHASIQGTARPTKYRCICNELKLTDDEIEQLTYYLCHMFARCTRSVSYPAPTYYAHLAAFRARALIQNVQLNIDNLQEEQRRKMTLQINKISPMFFV